MNFYEKIQAHLFCDMETQQNIFTLPEQDALIRVRAAYTKWFSDPYLTDIQIINFLKNEFKIKKSQAYYDLAIIKNLLGDIKNTSKDFTRYRVTEILLQAFQLAENAKNQTEVSKALAFIKAAEALVKVHNLNKNEMNYIQFENIVPIELEPPTKISVIGSKPIENLEQLIEKLHKKYYISD